MPIMVMVYIMNLKKDPSIFIADIHEDGRYLYPGSGNEAETGKEYAEGATKINIALNPNSGDEDFIAAFKKVEDFLENVAKPELINFTMWCRRYWRNIH